MNYKPLQATLLSSAVVVLLSFPAQARIYQYIDSLSSPTAIPLGGASISREQTVSGIPTAIEDVQLLISFADATDLGSTISGSLTLDPNAGNHHVEFTPDVQSYAIRFSSQFNDLDPNNLWALNLWDTKTGTGFENGLVSWTLNIQAVPEPVNEAMGAFAALFVAGGLAGSQRVRERLHRWRSACRPRI